MLLVVETITWKPHIETAIEIAIRAREAGEEVVYCNLRSGLPICEDSNVSHVLFDLPATRIRRSKDVIQSRGVQYIDPVYSRDELAFADNATRLMLSRCKSVEDLKQLQHSGFHDIGWGAISSTASVTRASDISLTQHRAMLADFIRASVLVYEKVLSLIEQYRPDTVLLFNGRFATTRGVMRAAEFRGVPWRIHERGGTKDRFWLTDFIPHDFDRLQELMLEQWNPAQESDSRAYFDGRRERVEREWHSFAANQERGRLPSEISSSKNWVTFFTSSEDEALAIGDSFINKSYPIQIDAIRALADVVDSLEDTRLCIRVHPHIASKSRADRRKLDQLRLPNVLMLGPTDPTDTYALMERSSVVCSYGSTVGIEATYWGRPSLGFARSYYDHLGVCEMARDREHIRAFLMNPTVFPQSATLPYASFWSRLGEPYTHYRADNLHRGQICGVYLDDSPIIRAARAVFGPIARLFGPEH